MEYVFIVRSAMGFIGGWCKVYLDTPPQVDECFNLSFTNWQRICRDPFIKDDRWGVVPNPEYQNVKVRVGAVDGTIAVVYVPRD